MRARRRAAARVLFAAFGMLNTITNSLLKFDEMYDQWGDTLTPSEKKYLAQIKARLKDNGEACRKLAWRLQRT